VQFPAAREEQDHVSGKLQQRVAADAHQPGDTERQERHRHYDDSYRCGHRYQH